MTAFATARRLTLAATAALLVSTAGLAVAAPARMTPNAPLTIDDWQAAVGAQLDARLPAPAGSLAGHDHLVTVVAVSIDGDGRFVDARIDRSSGVSAVDRQVLALAGDLAYPPLPVGYRGTPRTVLMQAYFGEAASPQEAMRHQDAVKALASRPAATHDAVQTAAIPGG